MHKNYNDICGVILTGGRSTRIGGCIKSLIKFNNKLIFDRIFENLQNQVQEIIINSNHSEKLFKKVVSHLITIFTLRGKVANRISFY